MIPKKIHYCWFGRNPKPKLAEKCIKSWQKYCPDYEIIEWNEANFDLSAAPIYVQQAYEMRRWAFVTDYVRLQVVYENGGIYLDTDVELKKKLDPLLEYDAYFGFEDGKHIATGLGFGAVQGHSIIQEMMDDYRDIPFVLPDGTVDLETCPARNTKIFLRHGLVQEDVKQVLDNNTLILPAICFCPIDYLTGKRKISKETYSIHWFGESWKTEEERRAMKAWKRQLRIETMGNKIKGIRYYLGNKILGEDNYEKLKAFLKRKA